MRPIYISGGYIRGPRYISHTRCTHAQHLEVPMQDAAVVERLHAQAHLDEEGPYLLRVRVRGRD